MTHWSLNIPAETWTWCWGAKCFCQGVRERHHQSPGCASIAYRLIQELVFWRDYISGAQLIRGLLAIRLFYSSSWEGGFLYNLEPLLHSWAGIVELLVSCLYQDLLFEEQHHFPSLPLLFPGVGSMPHGDARNKSTCSDTWTFSSDKAQEGRVFVSGSRVLFCFPPQL